MEDSRKQLQDDLDRIGEQRRTAEAAWKAAVEATDPAIERGLRGGLGPAEISRRVGVTDSYVRKIRKLKGLPSDPRYASNRPPVRVPETDARNEVPVAPAATKRPELPAAVAALNAPTATRLAGTAEERAVGGWAQRVLAAHPGVGANWHPYLLVAAALDEGILDERHVPH